jgi:transitional endoplasmic reticulum ATPase
MAAKKTEVVKAPKKKTEIEVLSKKLQIALQRHGEMQNSISRDGNQLVVPSFMKLQDAADAIMAWETAMEDDATQILEWKGHRTEILVAIESGLRKCFGQFFGTSSEVQTFFGAFKQSGRQITLSVGPGKTKTVPIGRVTIPGLPITMDVGAGNKSSDNPMEDVAGIRLNYKKKFEPLVAMIKTAVDEELKKNSVFKGQAVDSDFNFLDLNAFPTDKIVYSERIRQQLDGNVFGPVRNWKRLIELGLSVRRSILLHGQYGTGKTLTALLAAKCCLENGWTFMNVLPGGSITHAIDFANRYQPALVFFEDIDMVAGHGRTSGVNEILNVVDGFLSKQSKVMIVLTTNHTDKIEKAMLRPGRIDAVIKMGDVDANVLLKMIQSYCPNMTNGLDIGSLVKASEGFTPSFVAEACQRSVLYALERSRGNGGELKIASEDIEASLIGLRDQFELMTAKANIPPTPMDAVFAGMLEHHLAGLRNQISTMLEKEFGMEREDR